MKFEFQVNSRRLSSEKNTVSGTEILEIAGYNPVEDFDLYKKIQGHEFEPIQLAETVDLQEPGIERFRVIARAKITLNVDDEDYFTEEVELTPIGIFGLIGLDSAKFYLKQIEGHMDISYKDDEQKSIDMLGKPKFITCKKEPATVS